MSVADRLKQRRVERGFDTAIAAADAMGVPRATYVQNENGTREPSKKRLKQYADFYRCTPEWLLWGSEGPPKAQRSPPPARPSPTAPLLGLVGAGSPIEAIQSSDPDAIDVPAGYDDAIAFRVRGASCEPVFEDGDIVVTRERLADEAAFIGQFCVVETADGNGYLKQVVDGAPGHGGRGRIYTLRSPNHDDLPEQNIKSARPVVLRIIRGGR